jgi:hypothetical protein
MKDTITLGDVITEARGLLQDNHADEALRRWSDADLTIYANSACVAIRGKRPDARFDPDTGGIISVTTAVSTALSANLSIAAKWRQAIVNFMLHRAYLRDSEDTVNAKLSADYLQLFLEGLS